MIDVVLPVYNCPDIEDRCIRALLTPGTLPEDARIVVVDDASPDLTTWSRWAPALKSLGHEFIRHLKREGCHSAWNTGIGATRAQADVCLLGSDVVVPPGLLAKLAAALPRGQGVRAQDLSAAKYSPVMLGMLMSAQRAPEQRKKDQGIGSCCLLSRAALDLVGRFDPQFVMTFGDSDWNHRARDLGVTIDELPWPVFHGKSVSRKRLGAESDLDKDLEDHFRFLQKWSARKDVCEQHPMPPQGSALELKKHFWKEGEQ